MLLYITGSYPDNQEGIAAGAKVLLDAMVNNVGSSKILLLTTDVPVIADNISKNSSVEYKLFKNWKLSLNNIKEFFKILKQYPITCIHMEYPGDLYGKTFFASFLPLITRVFNLIYKKKVTFNVRLHEFSHSRFLRKLAIMPILLGANRIYVPSLKDRKMVSKLSFKKAFTTTIGTNIEVVSNSLVESDFVTVSYFGSVYPGKGIKRMLKIWKQIHDNDDENRFRFKIIGDVGVNQDNHFLEYHKSVWKVIDDYNLKNVIEVTGYLSDSEVSREIQHSQVATLLYEDGLTLRRGSFLAYLAHGIPIVTTHGDEESCSIFDNHDGVVMANNDNDVVDAVFKFANFSIADREKIRTDNIDLSKFFNWDDIAKKFLKDYGMI